jgi:hypothetical protein
VVERLVTDHQANAMLDAHTEVMSRLDATSERRAELQGDQRLLDATLLDGLEREPWPLDEHGQPAR